MKHLLQLIAVCVLSVAGPSGRAVSAGLCTPIFDATLYRDKPASTELGMRKISVIGARNWLSKPTPLTAVPEVTNIESWFESKSVVRTLLAIDLEHWPVSGDPAQVRESVRSYRELVTRVRAAGYGGEVGYYGVPPIRNYWQSIGDSKGEKYRAWQAQNDALKDIADAVDVLFPSLYTFYDKQMDWVTYATANLKEARRLANGKKVYAFLSPTYHDSNKLIGGRHIEKDYWALQLKTVAANADGIVIWGGYRLPWDKSAGWWVATQEFLAEERHACASPLPPSEIWVN